MLSTLRSSAALPQRLAAVRERDDDAVAGAHEAGELVLRLGEAAGRDRGPLRLELERLPARERVELGRRPRARPARAPPPPRRRARRPAARRSRAGGRPAARDRSGRAARRRGVVVLPAVRDRLGIDALARAARRPGRRVASATGCSARCVNGENARTCSISSPNSSTRSGSRPVDGKTSTMPPRTANWPRSSTRSTRS